MRILRYPLVLALAFICSPIDARADERPSASVDQVTYSVVCGLGVERYDGFDEEGMADEHQWAVDMAKLCLAHPDRRDEGRSFALFAVEFQRHAGRTARYRGFCEQATQDYETAIDYAYRARDWIRPDEGPPEGWEITILRDIADTHLTIGACEPTITTSEAIAEYERTNGLVAGGGTGEQVRSAPELERLALIAERQGRFSESAQLRGEALLAQLRVAAAYLAGFPRLAEVSLSDSWAMAVRYPRMRESIEIGNITRDVDANGMREVHVRMARALRLDDQLDEAGRVLETAELTPWRKVGPYRENLDLSVDREWAWLALARGKVAEAVRRGVACLTKYSASLHPGERVELLDLVSRGLEGEGDFAGALDRLTEAIGIVEGRRANLALDEHKQLYGGRYAELYRRACLLVIRGGGRDGGTEGRRDEGGKPKAESRKPKDRGRGEGGASNRLRFGFGERTVEESFAWAERGRARAMLDSMRRLGRRMAAANANGDTKEMKRIREQSPDVANIGELQGSVCADGRTAIVEYLLGEKEAWGWVVTRDAADLVRIAATTADIEREAEALKAALAPPTKRSSAAQPGARSRSDDAHLDPRTSVRADARPAERSRFDNSWEEPAAWLHEALIQPIASRIAGADRLVIVGDGALRGIPFETFLDRAATKKQRLLIQRKTVSYTPSATVLVQSGADRGLRAWTYDYWGFASTKFQSDGGVKVAGAEADKVGAVLRSVRGLGDLAPLPKAGREVESVALKFAEDRRRVFIDHHENGRTSKDELLSANHENQLKAVRFLHFATHAVLDSDRPFDSGLVLSPPFVDATEEVRLAGEARTHGGTNARRGDAPPLALRARRGDAHRHGDARRTAPRFRWDRRARRASILSLHEIGELDLGCELVVLSSCQGLGASPVEGDWLNGLTRAFLVAGSESVTCTLWDIPDTKAVQIVRALFRELRPQAPVGTVGAAEALRSVKEAMLTSPRHEHPAHWSGFVCYGGG